MDVVIPFRVTTSAIDFSICSVEEGGRVEFASTSFAGDALTMVNVTPDKQLSRIDRPMVLA
jgi:hypothetical protein